VLLQLLWKRCTLMVPLADLVGCLASSEMISDVSLLLFYQLKALMRHHMTRTALVIRGYKIPWRTFISFAHWRLRNTSAPQLSMFKHALLGG